MVARGLTVPALIVHINLGSSLHTKHCTTNTAHYKYCTSTSDPHCKHCAHYKHCTLQTLHITNTVHYKHCTVRTQQPGLHMHTTDTTHFTHCIVLWTLHNELNTAHCTMGCTLHTKLKRLQAAQKTDHCSCMPKCTDLSKSCLQSKTIPFPSIALFKMPTYQ